MANGVSSNFSTEDKTRNGQDDNCQLNDKKKLVHSIVIELKKVNLVESDYSIQKVPLALHKLKPEAYTPQVISIGPFHCKEGKEGEHLQTMETHKLRCLNRLLNELSEEALDALVNVMTDLEEDARKCYSEIIGLDKNEFVKMMVIDGYFILEFLRTEISMESDHFFSNTSWFWEISYDLFKLENQLPFFVLKHLYDQLSVCQASLTNYSFNDLIGVLLNYVAYQLCDQFSGPAFNRAVQNKLSFLIDNGRPKHFIDLLHDILIPPSLRKCEGDEMKYEPFTCSASDLFSAGVKFQKKELSNSSTTYLFDIDFNVKKGVLTIPTIDIVDGTEPILRNLIAFEQGQDCIQYFTEYAYFMDGLIDSVKDVELLMKMGIIRNNIDNKEDVITLFNNIGKCVISHNLIFAKVTKDLEKFHNKAWNKWFANLKQKYFNTPWASISFGGAVLVILLTIVQTICSIWSLVESQNNSR